MNVVARQLATYFTFQCPHPPVDMLTVVNIIGTHTHAHTVPVSHVG